MNNEPIPAGSKKPSLSKLLLLVLIPNLFWFILLKIDFRGGMGVTVLFLAVNLICSLIAGVGVARRREAGGLAGVLAAFFVGVILFFINWGIAISADLMFFNPIRS